MGGTHRKLVENDTNLETYSLIWLDSLLTNNDDLVKARTSIHYSKTFDQLDYQLSQAELLKTIVASGDFPHFLIFGPSGSGKKTRISCLLHALYGEGVQSLRIENHEYETPSKKKVEITTIGSNFHTQVNPR